MTLYKSVYAFIHVNKQKKKKKKVYGKCGVHSTPAEYTERLHGQQRCKIGRNVATF